MMKVSSPKRAGQKIVGLNGKEYQFDAAGIALVDEDSGFNLLPGYDVLEGTPAELVVNPEPQTAEVRLPDGPLVVVQGPLSVANREIGCPDGHTVAKFDSQARAIVPSTAGLDGAKGNPPGYSIIGPYEQPAPAAPVFPAPEAPEVPTTTDTPPADPPAPPAPPAPAAPRGSKAKNKEKPAEEDAKAAALKAAE